MAYTGTGITTPYTDTYIYSQDGTPLEPPRTTPGVLARYWYERLGSGPGMPTTSGAGRPAD
ncbi:MAG: hypothetical protein ACRDGS_17030 [Chloroflexota bacterium]